MFRTVLLIILCFLYFTYITDAQNNINDPYIWDFGIVEEGEILEHKFLLKNNADKILNIKNLESSCGCTIPKIQKKEILPFESTEIFVRFNTKGYSGKVEKLVYVHTDDRDNPIIKFTLRAEIIKKPSELITFDDKQSYKSTIDYILKTNRLWGISEVKINRDRTVTFVDEKGATYGGLLYMFDKENGFLFDQITLTPGESLELTDGHHVFITYKLIRVEEEKIVVEVIDKFDTSSFGGNIEMDSRQVAIKPYS
ncbi:MAG: DUF1573 domain-containing protein [Candidatus Omnitrophica bacterium]|nr:DUF1573 domain-containing protein [Candidatus Omnitrophota bacterium]